ncbi:DUF2851 family protein [Algoriphagus halophytocola]|uniref:DUF2851 family protein n=1 Tax=Algoriphagus halophytocola TaxID=2991499 RepID=A0ABY6MDW5_9BACT|nr:MULTISPECIES: DUF2851 family protein [unclassified Algoriphagus]UZD21965.1 DUF2851 family protein [Algoriphagus sp. TR-M5]WBL43216.1 DUF2851 family protein [Algoriphagus sp. TR-M9]
MTFREDFLQLVWKFQYFTKSNLLTSSGDELKIIQVGFHNLGEGPDFRDAVIEVGGVIFHGHVEVHRLASEWKQHAHGENPAYNSVVLHVVWENDREVFRNDGTPMPTLELKGLIFLDVWRNYEQLLDYKADLPCAHGLNTVAEIVRFSALEKALVERLQQKSSGILKIVRATTDDWEETAYRWLFTCFGFKVNSQAMSELSAKVPYKLLLKHRDNLSTLEAILIGTAGLLPAESEEPYVQHLIREYVFLKKKYQLESSMNRQYWKFMGVRPSNFPTVRIAQLAAILSQAPSLLRSVMQDSKDFSGFKKLLKVKPSDYWQFHYNFGKPSPRQATSGISTTVVELLVINYVIPLWFAYGRYFEEPDWQERCFDLLQEVPAENNHIIRRFQSYGWSTANAFDTQGMIGLYNYYCLPKKCLQCKIAQTLIKSGSK